MAYSFVVAANGIVEQALPMDTYGWHCRWPSRTHVGIAVLGDFRVLPPTQKQWDSLVWLVSGLSALRGTVNVIGHSDVPAGSSDVSKDCPGAHLDVWRLAECVVAAGRSEAAERLTDAGLVM